MRRHVCFNIYMRILFLLASVLFFQIAAEAQYGSLSGPTPKLQYQYDYNENAFGFKARKKLMQRNHGVIVGIQRGNSTAIELGGEAHWRKISLKKPHIIGATANMEYDFSQHMVGYKAGAWMKRGRVNFTYGANIGYHTDFKGRHIYTAGPAVGFRLLGLHLVNGYNFQAGDTKTEKGEGTGVNKLYMSLRYYFPMQNKFVWDKPTQKQKEKAKAKKSRQREKEKEKKKKARQENGRNILGIQF